MTNISAQPGTRERFSSLYNTIATQNQPVVTADAQAGAPKDISLAAAENIGPDNLRRLGYRALSMLTLSRINDTGIVGKVRETIELYEDPDGELTACFGDSVKIASMVIGGTFYGHPHREYPIPDQSKAIAVNSALLAMEQTLLGPES